MKFSEVMKDERVNDWIEKYFYLFFIFLSQFKASGKPDELLHYIIVFTRISWSGSEY